MANDLDRLGVALDDRDRARAQLAAIRQALDGSAGHVAPGDYAWSPELDRVRRMRRLLNLPEVIRVVDDLITEEG